MRRRGITLLEILIVVGITAMVTVASSQAYLVASRFESRFREVRVDDDRHRALEDRITSLLRSASMTNETADLASCFIGDFGQGGEATGTIANTLTFTAFSGRVPDTMLRSEDDFETQNEQHGPYGGRTEVSISMLPVGQPMDTNGLFLREQRPPDEDPTQGGYETVLSRDVVSIEFEFWDGLAWQPTWDSRTQTERRIPAAVRVTYQLDGDEEARTLIVRLPHSDVTTENPVEENA